MLRFTEHPADTISRYLVENTPVQELYGGFEAGFDDEVGIEPARTALAGTVGERDRRRLGQLVELAHLWDERPSVRPTDFVRVVEDAVWRIPRARWSAS